MYETRSGVTLLRKSATLAATLFRLQIVAIVNKTDCWAMDFERQAVVMARSCTRILKEVSFLIFSPGCLKGFAA